MSSCVRTVVVNWGALKTIEISGTVSDYTEIVLVFTALSVLQK